MVWNFTLNRKFTFKSAANIPIAMLKVALFYVVFIPVSTMLEHFLTTNLGDGMPDIADFLKEAAVKVEAIRN